VTKFEAVVEEMKKDFHVYVKHYDKNEYDTNKIFKEWAFEKFASMQIEIEELRSEVNHLSDPHRDYH
jgi:hypothetical protein